MYTMRYCQRALLRISFCLLLVCSANVAFAQTASLSAPQTDGLTIRFTINVPSALNTPGSNVQIRIDGISLKDINGSLSAMGASGCGFSVIELETGDDPSPQYLICMRNAQSQGVELTLNEPNRPTTMTVTLLNISDNYPENTNIINNTLNFTVNPLIRIRVKVFLEGPLAMTHPPPQEGNSSPLRFA